MTYKLLPAKLRASSDTPLHLDVPHQPSSRPRVRVVSLVPIDEGLPSCNPRYSGPATAKNDIVLPVEEVSSVARVQVHRLEASVWSQSCRRPLPETTHISLTAEALAVARHRSWVPVREADVGTV